MSWRAYDVTQSLASASVGIGVRVSTMFVFKGVHRFLAHLSSKCAILIGQLSVVRRPSAVVRRLSTIDISSTSPPKPLGQFEPNLGGTN